MVNRIPGFTWMPYNVGNRARRTKGHGLVCHVAVSEAAALRPYPGADWHAYLPKKGPGIQFVDLDLQAWTTGAGNWRMASFESQGGVRNADREPWTDDQIENAARFYAYLHESEGAPLQLMPDSRPTSKGLGYHRLGIAPWRVSGGEVWSSSRGKICPGSAKIAQLPDILARAREIVRGSSTPMLHQEDDMTPEQAAKLDRIYEYLQVKDQPFGYPAATHNEIAKLKAEVADLRSRLAVPGAPYDWLPALNNKVDALVGLAARDESPEQVAQAAADAKAIVDELAKRLGGTDA